MSKSISSASSPPQPIRILCLHGYTQSGSLFSSKTGALQKALSTGLSPRPVEFTYPTGPYPLRAEDIPGYEADASTTTTEDKSNVEAWGWWRRQGPRIASGSTSGSITGGIMGSATNGTVNANGHGTAASETPESSEDDIVYAGFEDGLATIARCIHENGPFDGVLGFSQGACAAAMLAALLERVNGSSNAAEAEADTSLAPFLAPFLTSGRPIQDPFKFAILYSGFRAPGRRYAGFWQTKIQTPSLHVRGGLDTVVDEARSEALVDAFLEDTRRVLVHPGGHFVPNQRLWTTAVLGFVRDVIDKKP